MAAASPPRDDGNVNIDGQAFFEALEDSVIVLDNEGRYLFANQVALRALRRSFAEIEGRSFRDVVPSTRGAPFDEAFRHAVAGGRAQRALGTSAMTGRDYEFTITPLNGRFIAVLRDVTEAVANKRRAEQAEAALRSSQERLQSVIDCAPFPIYAKDLDARYLLVNRSTAELFGRPADEILGHTDDELIDPATAAAFKRGELAALGKGEVRGEEKVRIGGKERTFLTTRFKIGRAS